MRTLVILVAVLCLMAPHSVEAADTIKLKHAGSVYKDGAELPLKGPEGLSCAPSALVVADTGNRRLVRYQLEQQGLRPEQVIPLPDTSPVAVVQTASGSVYVLDGKSRSILKLTAAGEMQGKMEIKGLPNASKLIPKSIHLDSEGKIYLLDIFSGRVIIADADEIFLRQISLPPGGGFWSDIAISHQGSIYLLDSVKAEIFQASAGEDNFTLLSKNLRDYVNFPAHLTVDGRGILYISDQNGSGLVLVGRDGSFLGRKLVAGWDEGMLQYPAQICINDQDQLFIADRNNNRVQMFSILAE